MRKLFPSLIFLALLAVPASATITKADLSTKIQTNLAAIMRAPVDTTQLKAWADAIAQAVVDEITTNADVLPTAHSGSPLKDGTGSLVTGKGSVQ